VDKLLVEFHDTSAPEEEIVEDKNPNEITLDAMIRLI